jgi:hypothetical protein
MTILSIYLLLNTFTGDEMTQPDLVCVPEIRVVKIRNPNIEALNKFEYQITEIQNV